MKARPQHAGLVALLTGSLFVSTAAGQEEALRSIPGHWDPVGESVAPFGVIPPFGDDVVRRPALAIQPATGEPALVVHRHGVLRLVGIEYGGAFWRISPDANAWDYKGDIAGFYSYEALAFDSVHQVLCGIALDSSWNNRYFVHIDLQTGSATGLTELYPELYALAFDPATGVLLSASAAPGLSSQDPSVLDLHTIAPLSGQHVYLGSTALPPDCTRVAAMAYVPDTGLAYAIVCRDYEGLYQLYEIDPWTTQITPLGPERPGSLEALTYDALTGQVFGVDGDGVFLTVNTENGALIPISGGVWLRGLAAVNIQQDGLVCLEYDGYGTWLATDVDNEQDAFADGCLTHALPGGQANEDLGRVDGISLTYEFDGVSQWPLVAWAQRVNDAYSEILVARRAPWGFVPIGHDAFGVPSNRLPGISRTLRDSTDPVLVLDADGNPVVAWRETIGPDFYEIYARRYDPVEDQWLEIGEGSASGLGISLTGGSAHSFDLALYEGQLILAHAHDGYIVLKYWDEGTGWWQSYSGMGDPGPNSLSGEADVNDAQPHIATYPGSNQMFITWTRDRGDYMEVLGRRRDGMGWTWPDVIHSAAWVGHPAGLVTQTGQRVAAWQEEQTTPWSQILAKYCDPSSWWSEIGPGSSTSGGISASPVPSRYPQLAVGPNSQPVIAWEEDGLAFVRRFGPPLDADCNHNGVPDVIDLRDGTSADCNADLIPDECEMFDGDGDGDIDAADLNALGGCMSGPALDYRAQCTLFDGNCDGAVDMDDFALMQWWAGIWR